MSVAYKTVVIDYAPKTKKMATCIEDKANEMELKGWKLITVSIANSAKAIMVFYMDNEAGVGGDIYGNRISCRGHKRRKSALKYLQNVAGLLKNI